MVRYPISLVESCCQKVYCPDSIKSQKRDLRINMDVKLVVESIYCDESAKRSLGTNSNRPDFGRNTSRFEQ